ncbi:MAG: phenylacetate-CoA oxygenase subunit PaaC [Betaproteobacteria bacterium]|nr:phenylacetate-CoA oxygenase subunit PaaC [Betaproteobacteria bacterium]
MSGGTRASAGAAPGADAALFEYVLRLGDNDVILAQRLAEWVGHGPVIEEDIALTNVGLDLLGQGRMWLQYAGEVEARLAGTGRSEDELAFLRDGGAYRNVQLVELPNGDFAATMARQFYFDHAHLLLLRALARSADPRVAEIAAKAAKEVDYHAQRSADWVIRLGDGTAESRARMQRALDRLWPYTGELFATDAVDRVLVAAGVAADAEALRAPWLATVERVLAEATLSLPAGTWMHGANGRGGRQGVHTEHLGHLLAEMQFLQRAYPGARW